LRITDKEIGCPTNTANLAKNLLELIVPVNQEYDIYHCADRVAMIWYHFAQSIFEENDLKNTTKIVKENNYRSFAKRPKFSVLKI
tara:strand:- start:117 stop:371 length:255 start_codon:yes stop_codon:yes gene_type:complete